MTEPDPMMTRINDGVRLHIGGERDAARSHFSLLWNEIGPDGDPLHRCVLAHHMADMQDEPVAELEWDLRALAAADSLTDERARRFDGALAVRGFYPSLHLNLGEGYRKLGDPEQARRQLDLARQRLDALGDDAYGDGIRAGLDDLERRLTSGS